MSICGAAGLVSADRNRPHAVDEHKQHRAATRKALRVGVMQEQLQAAAGTGSGKTVSEPTVARAYSKQAKISSLSSQG
jgi:hypothetical protein